MEKGSSIIESIKYTRELLQDPQNLVFMFPQGAIKSIYNNSIVFEAGVQKIISRSSPNLQVLFIANLLDYFSDPKPNIFMYIKKYSVENLEENSVESDYNKFYNEVLNLQKNKTA